MAPHLADGVRVGTRKAEEAVPDPMEVFRHDVQVRGPQQVMDGSHTPAERVVDRDHGAVGTSRLDHLEGIFERGACERIELWTRLAAGGVGIGAGLSLVGDARPRDRIRHGFVPVMLSSSRAWPTPVGSSGQTTTALIKIRLDRYVLLDDRRFELKIASH